MICPVCRVFIDRFGRCNCNSQRPAQPSAPAHDRFVVAIIIIVGAVLLWLPAGAQCDASCSPAPEPILGPGPCNSDTPHFCYERQIYLPLIASDVSTAPTPTPVQPPIIVTRQPTATPTVTATATATATPVLTLIIIPEP